MLKHTKKLLLPIKILACIFLILALGISACNPKPEKLQVQTIAQEQQFHDSKMYESKEPTLIVFANLDDVNNLKGFISDDAKEKLRTLDYSKEFAILILQGYKPGLCYGINITKIIRLRDSVIVSADFTEPNPKMACAAAVSSPYHLVQVEKTGNWNQDTNFGLIVDRVQIVSVTDFIP